MDTAYQPGPEVIAVVLLAERLVFGSLFAAHGSQKLFGWFPRRRSAGHGWFLRAALWPERCNAKNFSGKYSHRVITGGVGHNLPQEAPEAFAKAIVDVDAY